jgi:hypothetical protein
METIYNRKINLSRKILNSKKFLGLPISARMHRPAFYGPVPRVEESVKFRNRARLEARLAQPTSRNQI